MHTICNTIQYLIKLNPERKKKKRKKNYALKSQGASSKKHLDTTRKRNITFTDQVKQQSLQTDTVSAWQNNNPPLQVQLNTFT